MRKPDNKNQFLLIKISSCSSVAANHFDIVFLRISFVYHLFMTRTVFSFFCCWFCLFLVVSHCQSILKTTLETDSTLIVVNAETRWWICWDYANRNSVCSMIKIQRLNKYTTVFTSMSLMYYAVIKTHSQKKISINI